MACVSVDMGDVMLRVHFTAEDLARTTLAAEPDPLWETLLSLHLAQSTDGSVVFGSWRRAANLATRGGTGSLLRELAPPTGYSPDFLTPVGAGKDVDGALERVASTPNARIGAEMDYLMSRRPATAWTRELAAGRAGTLRRLVSALRSYHGVALQPYWHAIRRHVLADRARRAQQLTSQGIDRLLSTLSERVRWNPPVLEILDFVDSDVHLDGRGVLLQPSFFCWQAPTKLRDPGLRPILVYPTQPPPGTLRRHGDAHPPPLSALLGRTRAIALEATVSGCTTSELARRCAVSLAAASQQASVLREAGLISTRRDGGAVRHEITTLGLGLLNGADLPV